MNTEKTSINTFMCIKTHYCKTILATIQKLEKSTITDSSYLNDQKYQTQLCTLKILGKFCFKHYFINS